MINCNSHGDRWKMLTLALQCCALISQLVDLKHNCMSIDEDGQTRLFKMTLHQRVEFTKFAKNIRWLTETRKPGEDYWQGFSEHKYTDYEFFGLFDQLRKETMPVIPLLERLGNGEDLNEVETKTVVDFLHMLNGYALSRCDRGGCF